MQFKQKKITLYDVQWATQSARDRIDYHSKIALRLLNDDEKQIRMTKSLCPVCYYSDSRIGGSAITHTNCSLCEKELCFSNTCTDKLCEICAMGKGLCKHCGAAVNLKISRSLSFDVPSERDKDES